MTDLSPAAQAVLDAYRDAGIADEVSVAAVLRAAADQVVPEYETTPGGSKIWPSEPVPSIRQRFLAIADELEAQPREPDPYTEIIDHYAQLSAQHAGRCVYHAPNP